MVEEWARIIAERAEELGLGTPALDQHRVLSAMPAGAAKQTGQARHHLQFDFPDLRILISFSSIRPH
jgi:hypothetical protein